MCWWSADKDALLRKALMCDNREDLRTSVGYRTWEQVAQMVYSLEEKVSATLVKECHERYNDYTIYTMEDVEPCHFALMYPPWRTEEFEALRSLLHYTVPGGRARGAPLTWDVVTARMNEAHIVMDDFRGVTEVDYFSRTYRRQDVMTAWKTRIRPIHQPAEESGSRHQYPRHIDVEDPTAQDCESPGSLADDQVMEDQCPSVVSADDPGHQDSHSINRGRATSDIYSAIDDRGRNLFSQSWGAEMQGAQSVVRRDSGPKNQVTPQSPPRVNYIPPEEPRSLGTPRGLNYYYYAGMSGEPQYATYGRGTRERNSPHSSGKDEEIRHRRPSDSGGSFHEARDQLRPISPSGCLRSNDLESVMNDPQAQKPPSEAVEFTASKRQYGDDFLDPVEPRKYLPPFIKLHDAYTNPRLIGR